MKVFFVINLAILLLIAILYMAFVVNIKLNITFNETVVCININIFKFHKSFVFRFNYFNVFKNLFIKEKKKKRKLKINVSNLIRPFFIKNIDIYSECFEEKFSIAIEFSVVNIITKRGVFSE